jgi:multidrug efflux system membrane fusion protein
MSSQSRFQQLRSSRFFSLTVVLVCLAVLGGCAWYLSHRNAAQNQANGPAGGGFGGFGGGGGGRRAASTVAFAAATLADIPIRMEALGTVTPIAAATVRSQVAGVLTQITYTEGQTVKRGQPLALIDPRPFQLALDESIAQQARDEAQLENARVILERNRTLLSQDSIAQQDVDTQAATVKQLQGTVAADRAAVSTARLNLEYSNELAPIGGRVGLRPVDIGNYVSAGDTNGVATITQLSPIDVVFTLPADAVTVIQQQTHGGATLPTTVLDRTRSKVLGNGTFLTLDNQIDTQTGTVRAKARFENTDGILFPNEFVNVQLQVNTIKQAVVVPTNAIRHGPQGDFVFVIDQENTAHITNVKVGPTSDDLVSISEGLEAGDRVVTEGGDRLTDGSTVHLPGQAMAPPGGAQPGQGKKQWDGKRNGAGPNGNGSGKRRRPTE